jgi:hypothetical protein
MTPQVNSAACVRQPDRRKHLGVILVIIVLVWSSTMSSAQIGAETALMTAIAALVRCVGR